jgi:hypothetical protein
MGETQRPYPALEDILHLPPPWSVWLIIDEYQQRAEQSWQEISLLPEAQDSTWILDAAWAAACWLRTSAAWKWLYRSTPAHRARRANCLDAILRGSKYRHPG